MFSVLYTLHVGAVANTLNFLTFNIKTPLGFLFIPNVMTNVKNPLICENQVGALHLKVFCKIHNSTPTVIFR